PREGARPARRRAAAAGDRGQRLPRPRRHAPAVSAPLIRLRRLEKRYGRRRALAGIDLTIDERQIVGVVGPDGAGKTTLLRALAGLLVVDPEEATVLGTDLRGDVTELKAHIGYVPQTFSLHRDLTVDENLRFTTRLHRLAEAEFVRRKTELLARTGLAPFAGRTVGQLSGGMKQKLAIANALVAAPALPYVQAARATGRFVRVEVHGGPEPARVLRDLEALPGAAVRLVEPLPVDMESTLLALSSP